MRSYLILAVILAAMSAAPTTRAAEFEMGMGVDAHAVPGLTYIELELYPHKNIGVFAGKYHMVLPTFGVEGRWQFYKNRKHPIRFNAGIAIQVDGRNSDPYVMTDERFAWKLGVRVHKRYNIWLDWRHYSCGKTVVPGLFGVDSPFCEKHGPARNVGWNFITLTKRW
jgi:hypothetical protein